MTSKGKQIREQGWHGKPSFMPLRKTKMPIVNNETFPDGRKEVYQEQSPGMLEVLGTHPGSKTCSEREAME